MGGLSRAVLPLLVLALTTCNGDATGPGKTTVGPEGGTVSLAQGRVKLSIPSGALSNEVELTATPTTSFPASNLVVVGSTFEIGPAGTTLAKPVTITITFDPSSLPEGVRENEVRLFQAVGASWATVLDPSVDTEAHTVSGRVSSLGVLGAKGLSVATVEVAPPHFTLEQGRTKGFSALARDASGMALPERVMAWNSSDETVAIVDAEGLVTAVGIGSSSITATSEGSVAHADINTWSCVWQTEVPETECQALIDFYDAGTQEDWRYSEAWVPTPYPCDWRGVTCDGGSVSRIMVRSLTGSISNSVGDLSNLTELDLYMNQLTGPIPSSLGRLSKLSRLDLSSNDLSGPIPSELGDLSNLTVLWLYWNELSGPIPQELGRLENLTHLRLDGNQLSGPIPPELGNLEKLLRLSLFDNLLSGPIPPELGNLSRLQSLGLGVSPLSGSIPPELGNLSNLVHLGITNTQLSGPIPVELGNLVKLELMNLYGNQLSGPVPLAVAQLGGQIQAQDGGGPKCVFFPPGNADLIIPDTQDYQEADQNGDGKICGLTIGGG